jgi:chromosome segregation ATPase
MKASPKKQTKKKILRKVPARSGDLLVTQRMLSETKNELKKNISSVRQEVKSLEHKMEARFAHMESRFSTVDSKISGLDAKVESVLASVHSIKALMEEQDFRNRAVLEGYDQIYRRQEDYERRLKKLEKNP